MSYPQASPLTVHEFVRALTNIADPDVLVQKVGQKLQELFEPDLVLILQMVPRHKLLAPLYSHGYDPDVLDRLGFSSTGPLSEWLTRNRRCLDLSKHLGLLDQLDPAERELLGRLRVQMCLPLISLSQLLGVVFLGSRDPLWRLDSEDIELLEMLITQAALALENTILHSQQKDRLRHFLLSERLAAVGQLAAGMAHEISNPLTAISSTMQYILEDFAPGHPRRPLVEGLLSEVERISRTIRQLLDLAQVRDVQPRAQNLLDIVEQSLLLVEGKASQHQVEIIRSYRGQAFLVMSDADALKQLFLNLLLNAIQAMQSGGTIQVRLEPWELPFRPYQGSWVQVEIRDTGCGIAEADRQRLFEPFFTTKPEGTGLGLAICQSIVERHNGEIEIQSQLGKGTSVFIRFPLNKHGRSPGSAGEAVEV